MSAKRGSTFFTLDVEEAVVTEAALAGLLRQIKRMPNSDSVRELNGLTETLHARISTRLAKYRKRGAA